MKITLPKSAFDSELDMVSSVVKTRTILPVLGFAKLESHTGSPAISLWSTDLDCYCIQTNRERRHHGVRRMPLLEKAKTTQ